MLLSLKSADAVLRLFIYNFFNIYRNFIIVAIKNAYSHKRLIRFFEIIMLKFRWKNVH